MSGSEGAGFRQRSPATRLRLRPPTRCRTGASGATKPEPGRRRLAGADQRAAAGVYRLGALRGEPSPIAREPGQARWHAAGWTLAPGRSAGVRPVRLPHGDVLSHKRARPALSVLARQRLEGRGLLPVGRRARDRHGGGAVAAGRAPAVRLEVSLALAEEVEIDRTRRRRQRALRLEQAAYEVARAERQYNAVEPENRLV